ncbi:hypothetical protein GQ42DRAFT_19127 [Ramicandelaber brevisporus]|nr:hypothetical protein GQ42DRAFT_19127 [Ramicandelaber brevisporus]
MAHFFPRDIMSFDILPLRMYPDQSTPFDTCRIEMKRRSWLILGDAVGDITHPAVVILKMVPHGLRRLVAVWCCGWHRRRAARCVVVWLSRLARGPALIPMCGDSGKSSSLAYRLWQWINGLTFIQRYQAIYN